MNILILVHNLTGGGAERVAASWANGLLKRGHRVSVMSDYTQPVTYELDAGIERIQIPTGYGKGPLKGITARVLYPLVLRHSLQRLKIDVVISVLYFKPQITEFVRKTLKPRPHHIMTDHNVFERPHDAPMSESLKHLKFNLGPKFELLTVLTEVDRRYLEGIGFTNVATLHNPLFLPPVQKTPPKQKIVLACGRINARVKGFDLLIRAWNFVAPAHPDWRLRIVGEGSDASIQELLSLSDRPESVEIKPYTANIADEYLQASIFVLSSRYEGWGLVLVEAMSQGCAALACNFGGRQAEIITDGVNGLLCQTGSIEAIADGLERLISDDALRTRLQAAAPSSTVRFNEDATAERLESLIATIHN